MLLQKLDLQIWMLPTGLKPLHMVLDYWIILGLGEALLYKKSELVSLCTNTPEELIMCYKTTLAGTFNTHAPLKSKMVTVTPRPALV